MKILDIEAANGTLGHYAINAKNGALIVTRKGKAVAALLAINDRDLETLSLGANPRFKAILGRSRRQVAAGKVRSLDEVRKRWKDASPASATTKRRACN